MDVDSGNNHAFNRPAVYLDHIRLDVADIGVAESFYTGALGLRRVVRYDLSDRIILQMAPDGVPAGIELWQERGLVPRPHPTHHVAFRVEDVPALVEHIRALGYPIVEEPYAIGEETVAFVADPDRHAIELNDFRGRPVSGARRWRLGTPQPRCLPACCRDDRLRSGGVQPIRAKEC